MLEWQVLPRHKVLDLGIDRHVGERGRAVVDGRAPEAHHGVDAGESAIARGTGGWGAELGCVVLEDGVGGDGGGEGEEEGGEEEERRQGGEAGEHGDGGDGGGWRLSVWPSAALGEAFAASLMRAVWWFVSTALDMGRRIEPGW